MSLRIATENDLPVLLRYCRNFWENSDSVISDEFDEEKTRVTLENTLKLPYTEGIVLVTESEKKLRGFIIGLTYSPFFSSEKVAIEAAYWIEPEYRKNTDWYRLLQAYTYWADRIGCKSVQLGIHDPRLAKICKRKFAFEPIEQILQKELN